jgi:3-(3-hydroxy-phenyl)propionate hydroxylase
MPSEPGPDVLVVGAGPCGITLANLLATYGVRSVVLEAEAELYPHPRAVGIDDESLRTYQAVGVADELLADIIQNTPIRYHTSWGRVMAHVEPSARPFGWPRRNTFLQPRLEATLRARAVGAGVDLRLGSSLLDYEQDGDAVRARVAGPDGAETTVTARYLVGADGGRSTVRRLAGIELLGSTAPQRWLVVDVADDDLDAPYSAVHCDPERPVLMVPLPYGHRRFEFKLLPGDDEAAMADPEHVLRTLIAPRYPATSRPRVLRSTVYWHHSRTAERFRDRRVLLAGDAAHLQPPFFGQGMNSGIRDAMNLAWKLAFLVRGWAGEALLQSYDAERRPHAATMVDFATRMGELYEPRNRVTERVRDLAFRAVQLVPGAREYILQMKYKPMPRYTTGVVVPYAGGVPGAPVGSMFGQPQVETADGDRVRLDDILGSSFAVLGLGRDPAASLDADALAWCEKTGTRLLEVVGSKQGATTSTGTSTGTSVRVEDLDGHFRDWRLRRPGDEIIVLRPDRYVAAVCTATELEDVVRQLWSLLG